MTRLPFELFLGFRYLKPKRTFVSVITLISLAGVVIGVWALIVVISVMTGFDQMLREKLMGMHAHVTVGGALIEDSGAMMARCQQEPRVKAASPFVLGLVLMEFNKRIGTPYLKGIDPVRELQVSKLGQYVKQGALDLDGEKVVIGRELANQYGIFLGDKITIYSPRNFEKKGEEVYLPLELTVTGIFDSGMYEYDVGLVFTSLATAQELYAIGTAVHGIELMTDDPLAGARAVSDAINATRLPAGVRAQTWAELNRRLLGAIQVEKTTMFLILLLLVVVAAFCIMSTLITSTVQKTREIGVLKALGATAPRVSGLVLAQGFAVGVFGVAAGLALGFLTIENLGPIQQFLSKVCGVDVFPREIYNFAEIPSHLTVRDGVTITVAALLICTLGGLIPALWAAKLEPVEALRHE